MKVLNRNKIYIIVVGFLALCWFLIRVIPKPGRATYPCQRAAFPLASAFVIWLTSLFSSTLIVVKFKRNLKQKKIIYSCLFALLFVLTTFFYAYVLPTGGLFAKNTENYIKAYWSGEERIAGLENNTIKAFDEVAIVQSDKENATDITAEEIEAMVREAVALSGGMDDIIDNGDCVILKPNLVGLPIPATEELSQVSGITTDWRVTKAVAKMVREINPDGKIYITECPVSEDTDGLMSFYKYTSDNFPEVDAVFSLVDSCGAFEDYEDNLLTKVYLDENVKRYPDDKKPNNSAEFYLNKVYYNADVVISIPVLKNHSGVIITGAVKNLAVGMTPPNIYGNSSTFTARWNKLDHDFTNLNNWVHDFYLCKTADFVVVDGLQGCSFGPIRNDMQTKDMQHNMRLILAGRKALSIDAVCSNLMSIDPSKANYMVYLDKEEYNVGTIDSRFIKVKGRHISDVREAFDHTVPVTKEAVYSDYDPPIVSLNSYSIEGDNIYVSLTNDNDLKKVEIEVNGHLLNQACIGDFDSITFEVENNYLPVDEVKIIVSDKFYNQTYLQLDESNITNTTLTVKQNYPNPYRQSTTIEFSLFRAQQMQLHIRDINGRIIETIVDSKLSVGRHKYTWGENAPEGIYFYILIGENGQRITNQMIKK